MTFYAAALHDLNTDKQRTITRPRILNLTICIALSIINASFLARVGRTELEPTDLELESAFIIPTTKVQTSGLSPGNHTFVPIVNQPFNVVRPNLQDVFVPGREELVENADKDGPVIDFAIAGFPKCGTTSMLVTLSQIAPMKLADVCTPLYNMVYYTHVTWPKEFDPNNTKPLRGIKCPAMIDRFPPVLDWNTYLPTTKLMIGVRHPVLWFQSFYNMFVKHKPELTEEPYDYLEACDHDRPRSCNGPCGGKKLFCVERSKFHLRLAELGKTPLEDALELQYFPSNMSFHGPNRPKQIQNPILLYETSQLSDKMFWKDVAAYLNYPNEIPISRSKAAHATKASNRTINICDSKFDRLRQLIMPSAYAMSNWICDYFVEKGVDVYVSNKDHLCSIIRSYRNDPCGRLIRLNMNGSYVLDPSLEDVQQ